MQSPPAEHETIFPPEIQAAALEAYRSSARLNSMRAEGLQGENAHLHHQISLIHRSLSWRVTVPLRAVRSLSLGRLPDGRPLREIPARLEALWKKGGLPTVMRALRRRMTRPASPGHAAPGAVKAAESAPPPAPYNDTLAADATPLSPHVLIIAELSLRQCAKYRVWQKQDILERLGWRVTVVDWRDINAAMSALQLCTQVVFYRVPGFDDVMKLVAEAHRLRLDPAWEVDDLIFDADEYRRNGNIDSLPAAELDLLMSGVVLFRRCMLACGRGIASTRALARAMRDAGLREAAVVENALDRETIEIAASLPPRAPSPDGRVWVCYGSGTNTHDEDFRQAESGLLTAMEAEPRLCLRVVGELALSSAFDRFGDRVERLAPMPYRDYLATLSQTDIAVAPLQATLFNDCKSNIKFLEAAIVSVPAICSPRDAFRAVLRHSENGLLAEGNESWREAFLALARDEALRLRLADSARTDVTSRYAPEAIARTQGEPAFGLPGTPPRDSLRVMAVNVYFAPRSFGGATIIAEEMAHRLRAKGVPVGVMTSRPHLDGRLAGNIRYVVDGVDVLSAITPGDLVGALDNPQIADQFVQWLDAYAPDVVHIHSIQGLGTALVRVCLERGVPYVITLHDAWWLCDRQFMVRADGRYCLQTRIDQRVCQMCQPQARHLADRANLMRLALDGAALLLSPSESHRQLFLANGVAPERIVVNRNGFRWPERARRPRPPGAKLRLGYVGGTDTVKGYSLLKEALESLERADWELVLVDNKLNLGFRSIDPADWTVRGELRIVPAYGQDGLDDFFDRIDVLLFPSQWKESYGLTVREALSRDVWVVTTGPGGQSEDVTEGVNGSILPIDGRSETWTAAISALLDQPGKLDGYVNPEKSRLATYEAQADELLAILRHVSSRKE